MQFREFLRPCLPAWLTTLYKWHLPKNILQYTHHCTCTSTYRILHETHGDIIYDAYYPYWNLHLFFLNNQVHCTPSFFILNPTFSVLFHTFSPHSTYNIISTYPSWLRPLGSLHINILQKTLLPWFQTFFNKVLEWSIHHVHFTVNPAGLFYINKLIYFTSLYVANSCPPKLSASQLPS